MIPSGTDSKKGNEGDLGIDIVEEKLMELGIFDLEKRCFGGGDMLQYLFFQAPERTSHRRWPRHGQ